MEVCIYAATVGRTLEWRLTFHIEMDCAYWLEQSGGKASLLLFEPVLSFSDAILLLAALPNSGAVEQHDLLRVWDQACKQANLQLAQPLVREVTEAQILAEQTLGLDVGELLQMEKMLSGRSLSLEELLAFLEHHGLVQAKANWRAYIQAAYLRGQVQLKEGFERSRNRRIPFIGLGKKEDVCRRCGSPAQPEQIASCRHCSGPCLYCAACLTMGRIQSCSLLIYGRSVARDESGQGVGPMNGGTDEQAGIAQWGLSPAQGEAVAHGLAYLSTLVENRTQKPGQFLIWAVTGAGKTEMMFPLVERELRAGGRVLIATPRRDVVLELEPRLKKAFPERKVITLYGGSEERWEYGDITLATTHQLLRFSRAFHLVVIDEIDAFPFHNNPMLQKAAERVCARNGAYVWLSATPPPALVRETKRERLAHVKVPVRFHRHPLPVPRLLRIPEMSKWKGRLPRQVVAALEQSLGRGAQVFVFVPRIRDAEPVAELLRGRFSGFAIDATSSHDPLRADKVVHFRQGLIRLLVTTTILERGVTVPKTDVFIFQADSGTFDSAALIQMAGRSGRSKDDPNGLVFFAASAWTNAQARAIAQIRLMNRLAKKKGYLLDSGKGM